MFTPFSTFWGPQSSSCPAAGASESNRRCRLSIPVSNTVDRWLLCPSCCCNKMLVAGYIYLPVDNVQHRRSISRVRSLKYLRTSIAACTCFVIGSSSTAPSIGFNNVLNVSLKVIFFSNIDSSSALFNEECNVGLEFLDDNLLLICETRRLLVFSEIDTSCELFHFFCFRC